MMAKKAGEIVKTGQISILTSYLETIQHLKYEIKWKKTIKSKFNNLRIFHIWKLIKWSLNQFVILCK